MLPSLYSQAEHVYILVNTNSADSGIIADYYADKRAIPKENILSLAMPSDEEITLSDYVQHIHNPLLKLLLDKGIVRGMLDPSAESSQRMQLAAASHTIDYLVLTKGVPLKFTKSFKNNVTPKSYINSIEKDQASVDSELSAILLSHLHKFEGFVENPAFLQAISNQLRESNLIRVARLDAPNTASVLRLIDDSVFAESFGLRGRAYFDFGGPYKEGDEWLFEASQIARSLYFDVEIEYSKRHFDYSDRLDAPAIYMGWYLSNVNAQWRNRSLPIPRGSIAYHLYSFSAGSLRNPKKGWVAGLIEKGFSASFGYVYEPFLSLTVRPDYFLSALSSGSTLGESYYFSNPALSWQSILVGDPLYRPFKQSLKAQMDIDLKGPFENYVYLNQFYADMEELGTAQAISRAYEHLSEHFTYALLYKLSSTLHEENRYSEAIELIESFDYTGDYATDEVYVIYLIADLLDRLGEKEKPLELLQHLIEQPRLPKNLEIKILKRLIALSLALEDFEISSKTKQRLMELEENP